ncbi:MAG: S-adenosylmethionine decarboxylase proenzyme [Chlamydiae bacterium]|nr:S-adenosylmethionine decarboxylase proenzyme [Chlamydiota bacterium]
MEKTPDIAKMDSMKSVLWFFCIAFSYLGANEHVFEGKHFLASYCECDPDAISDVITLEKVMHEAVLASGATILDSVMNIFPPDGLTLVILLSESHASIHTYPEHCSCFVDLFTCGRGCKEEEFDRVLRAYLQPKKVDTRILIRHQEIHDFSKSHGSR